MDEPIQTATLQPGSPALRRALVTSIAASTIGMTWVAVALGMPLTMFMVCLGASGWQIGLSSTVQQLAVLMQLPSSVLAERLHRRRAYWGWFALLHRLVWLVPACLPVLLPHGGPTAVWIVLATLGLSSLFAHIGVPVWFSWMADLVPAGIAGRFWGVRQSVTMFAFVTAAWTAGRVLDLFHDAAGPDCPMAGYAWLFAAATVSGAADILVHWTVPEPPPHVAEREWSVGERMLRTLRNRDFLYATAGFGVWLLAMGFVAPFSLVYLRKDLGATYEQLAVLAAAGSLGALACGIPTGMLIDRFGARRVGMCVMVLAIVLGDSLWFAIAGPGAVLRVPLLPGPTPQFVVVLCVAFFLGGAMGSGVALCQIQLLSRMTPREGRTFALALHWSLTGLVAAVGPLIGGALMDVLRDVVPPWRLPAGVALSPFHLLIALRAPCVAFVAVPLLARVHARGWGLRPRQALALLRRGPLRPLMALYGVQLGRVMRLRWPRERGGTAGGRGA